MPQYFSATQMSRIIQSCDQGRDAMFVVFLWRTALRADEALNVLGEDINVNGTPPQLRVRKPKGGAKRLRLVPLHPELVGLFRVLTIGPKERLFPFTYSTANRIVQRAIAASGEQAWGIGDEKRKPGCHTIRHSAARYWLTNSVEVNRVSIWLGHSSPQVTLDVYERLAPDDLGRMDGIR